MAIKPITIDFETMPIQSRPKYPPEPTSVSILLPTWKKPKFFAWGQRTGGNNCAKADAARALAEAYRMAGPNTPILCHHSKFDLEVAEKFFSLKVPDWRLTQDTMFLLFLQDPHQQELGLKPSSERLLGMPPEEQDAVKTWVLAHKKQLEADYPEIITDMGGIKPSNAGAFVGYAPGDIVGPYANGDVERTAKLFHLLLPEIIERGMLGAYERERRLMPILMRNEREGIRVDTAKLAEDQVIYEAAQKRADDWIRKSIKEPGLDLDSDIDVAKAFEKHDVITEWTLTATGRNSTSRKNMKLEHFSDRKMAATYGYRQKCATMLETFIRPWQHFTTDGWMHTNWNQVRQARSSKSTAGARTGRPSSNDPNFLNMPKEVADNADMGFIMPTHIKGLPGLPKIRSYILPDKKGHVVGRRDFNQQELRMLAHFEDGALLQAYLSNPKLDVHSYLRERIVEMLGLNVDRKVTKELNFGYIYGQGLGSMADKLNRPVEDIKRFRDAQMLALPGFKQIAKDIKMRSGQGLPITTWGGRQYFVEPPSFSKRFNKMMSYEYKLINYLVQGSSADVTKESIIRYDEARKEGRFMLSVYDENDISVPLKALKSEMLILRECMMGIEVDVPLLSDGEWGYTLGDLEDLKEPPPDLSRWGI